MKGKKKRGTSKSGKVMGKMESEKMEECGGFRYTKCDPETNELQMARFVHGTISCAPLASRVSTAAFEDSGPAIRSFSSASSYTTSAT
jgi:hypothetical protein